MTVMYLTGCETLHTLLFRLHRMHEMQTIVTDDPSVSLSVGHTA